MINKKNNYLQIFATKSRCLARWMYFFS